MMVAMPDAPLTDLGKALERARLEAEGPPSKREVAERAGLSESYWNIVITGTDPRRRKRSVKLRTETIVRACNAVGVPPRRGLLLAGYMSAADLYDDDIASPETLSEIIDSVRAGEFTQEDAEAILDYIADRRLRRHPELADEVSDVESGGTDVDDDPVPLSEPDVEIA